MIRHTDTTDTDRLDTDSPDTHSTATDCTNADPTDIGFTDTETTTRHRLRGVTLLELLVALVVTAILAVVAVPSYRQYLERTHRTEAKSALLRLQANQERWYLQHNSYTADLEALGFTAGRSENGVYTLSVATAGGLTHDYSATAVASADGGRNGVRMTGDDECRRFSIDSSGRRAAWPDPAGRCW